MKKKFITMFILSFAISLTAAANASCLYKINRNDKSIKVQKEVIKLLESKGCTETNIEEKANVYISETKKYVSPTAECWIMVEGDVNNSSFSYAVKTKDIFKDLFGDDVYGAICVVDKASLEQLLYRLEMKLDKNL